MTWDSEEGDVYNIWMYATVNNCAFIRKSAWEKVKYNEQVFYAEDKVWAYHILQKGYGIIVNIPLFYMYHKHMTRKETLTKRAQEEVSFILTTGKPFRAYPNDWIHKTNFVYAQLRGVIMRIDSFFRTRRAVKKFLRNNRINSI